MHRIQICLAFALAVVLTSVGFAQQADTLNSKFAHVATEQCWLYSSWNAKGTYDSNSPNHAEQLLAEPEIQTFIDDLIKRIGLLGPAMLADRPAEQQKLIHSIGPKLANAMFKRAGCVYLKDVKFDRNQEPSDVKAALVMDAGQDAVQLVEQMTRLFAANNDSGKKATVGSVEFSKFLISDKPKIELFIGNSDELLVVGIGEQTVANALRRIGEKQSPSWLKDFQSHQRLKHVTSLGYLNVDAVRGAATPFLGPQGEMMIGVAGLGNVESLETCSGFSQGSSVSRMLIRIDGRPEGILDLSAPEGISSTDLQSHPKDSLFAVGLSIDPGRTFRFIQMASLQMNRNRDMISQMLQEIKRETGIDLRNDVIENLGKTWTFYNGAGDGWMTGMTLAGTVKDPEKLSSAMESLIKTAILESEGEGYAPRFSKRTVGDAEVYTLRIQGKPFPMEPSWCISKNQILVGLYPQAVQSALQRSDSNVLIDQSQFAFLSESFSGKSDSAKLLGMSYVDTATQFEFAYPYIQMLLSMGRSMFEDVSDLPPTSTIAVSELLGGIRLPPARTIHKHLQPSIAAIRQTDVGIEFEASQTIPSIDASYVAPIAIGMLLPAVQQVRTSARRTVSMNNMRQQILAALNYESAFQRFPAGYSTDKDGKKLLSWRVHVLPFIEQNNLYEQFKLDEPWDSDNNKRLVEKMPDVFRSPLSQAKTGMTVYRGIGGRTGVLGPPRKPGAGGVGFGNITDGSSNTLFLVEASDQLAVPWTQPDEGLSPEDFDLSKIFGLYPKGTNAARCDGSVFFVPKSIEKRTFKLLMEMNDGNIIPEIHENSDGPSRQERAEHQSRISKLFVIDNGEVELTVDNMLNDTERAELARRQRVDVLREVALAMLNYESAFRKFPTAYSTNQEGKPLLSWRVQLLPFLDENGLYEQFRMDEPWDSDHNRALLDKIPDCYRINGSQAAQGRTTILAIGGPNGMISKPEKNGPGSHGGIGFGSIRDGSSNTMLLVEVGDDMAVQWTKPTEFDPDAESIKKLLGRKNGFAAAISDGSGYEFPASFPIETLKAMFTRNGGEVVQGWDDQLRNR